MSHVHDTMNLVKKHIQNLIAGHGIEKHEFMFMYKEIAREAVKAKVDKLFAANNIHATIEKTVQQIIKQYLNELMNKDKGHWSTNRTRIEDMIREECDKQIETIIRENFKVTLKGTEQKFGG